MTTQIEEKVPAYKHGMHDSRITLDSDTRDGDVTHDSGMQSGT